MPKKINFNDLGGWTANPKYVDEVLGSLPHPLLSVCGHQIKDSGRGKRVDLSQFVKKVFGKDINFEQTIGDCVSQSGSTLATILLCIDAVQNGSELDAVVASEPLYALSRVECGKSRIGTGDGSFGAWMGMALKDYGILLRKKYGKYDLTKYDGNKAREWGMPNVGCPDELEPICKLHQVRAITLVTDYYSAIDALANGYVINICSSVGFLAKTNASGQCVRDKNGFLYPSGSWGHSMSITQYDDRDIPSVFIHNSCGTKWITGPKRYDTDYEGGFWCMAETFQKILEHNDSFAYSNVLGFPPRELKLRLL